MQNTELLRFWADLTVMTRGVLVVLCVMLAHVAIIVIRRDVYGARLSRQAAPVLAVLERTCPKASPGEIAVAANRALTSHVGRVVAAGLHAFDSAPADLGHGEVVEFGERRVRRFQAIENAEMKRGLGSLASVIVLAPMLGFAGTVAGLFYAFRGGSNTPWGWRTVITETSADALTSTAFGLIVGAASIWAHNHLLVRLERHNLEMENALLLLVTHFHANVRSRTVVDHTDTATSILTGSNQGWEIASESQQSLLACITALWLYCMFEIIRAFYSHFL